MTRWEERAGRSIREPTARGQRPSTHRIATVSSSLPWPKPSVTVLSRTSLRWTSRDGPKPVQPPSQRWRNASQTDIPMLLADTFLRYPRASSFADSNRSAHCFRPYAPQWPKRGSFGGKRSGGEHQESSCQGRASGVRRPGRVERSKCP